MFQVITNLWSTKKGTHLDEGLSTIASSSRSGNQPWLNKSISQSDWLLSLACVKMPSCPSLVIHSSINFWALLNMHRCNNIDIYKVMVTSGKN